ncbi:MAG: ion transporter [Phycisphaerales bacterium]|nr:ion transporter [Phycisphaerales bacterium]
MRDLTPAPGSLRFRMHEIIFEAETPAGKAFDVTMLVAIILSVIAVSLESVADIREQHGTMLRLIEWIITIAFTIEYVLRLACVGRPLRYARSFFGIVDLLAIVPTYLSVFFVGSQSLAVIRAIRLLRIARVFKLVRFIGEAEQLERAMRTSLRKITVFLGAVLTLVVILGAAMYLIEGEESGFTSIPQSVYWAIVTMTTVGYGDIAPQTVGGKFLASIAMIIGYGIIAVPTGIMTVELGKARKVTADAQLTRACPGCGAARHDPDAKHCKFCGTSLGP